MSKTTASTSNGAKDDHSTVRFFKLLEVAYNLAKNGYYERADRIASEATEHYEEAFETN
jgi:hypothetical protein